MNRHTASPRSPHRVALLTLCAALALAACGGADSPPDGRGAPQGAGDDGTAGRLALKDSALPLAEQDQAYSTRLEGDGGNGPYRYAIVGGRLPPGLALNGDRIAGSPTEPGEFAFTLQIADASGHRSTRALSILVEQTSDVEPATPQPSAELGAAAPERALALSSSRRLADGPAATTATAAAGNLLAIVEAMPEGTWSKVNLNVFSNVWVPANLRNLHGDGNPTPRKVLSAWSSMAWDPNREMLWIFGGGHANYRGNEVYGWRASTQKWERGSLPSWQKYDAGGIMNPVDGPDNAPASAHTYDNGMFLPKVDRLLVLGGAADRLGGHFLKLQPDGTHRPTGPYFFDPSRAHPDKVGGTTGSHVQRVSPYPQVVGGQMWHNRDRRFASPSGPPTESFVNGCTAYAVENGKDVVFVRTVTRVYKYTVHDLNNPDADTWDRVGTRNVGEESKATCGYDTDRKILLRTGSQSDPFVYWNMNNASPTNTDVNVRPVDPTGEFNSLLKQGQISLRECGMDFDPVRRNWKLWCGGGGRVWSITAPATLGATGWTVQKEPVPAGAVPGATYSTGILGKWKYIENFDVFMGLQDSDHGNVWVYKPVGWRKPDGSGGGGGNQAPTVALTSPAANTSYVQGMPITVGADANDSDGSIARVEFYSGSTKIGEATGAPYTFDWTNAPVGSHDLLARATDNLGVQTVSSSVRINVEGAAGSNVSVTLQRGHNGYTGSAETYLSSYHKGSFFGASKEMLDQTSTSYAVLVKFAIFRSEGGPVPDGATLVSARLSLYKSSGYDMVYGLHRSLRAWPEGGANWNQAAPGTPWGAPGATAADVDYAAQPDATVAAAFNPGWLTFDVKGAIEQMRAGQPFVNNGWRLRRVSGDASKLKRFHTSEYATDTTLRPKLEIVYQP